MNEIEQLREELNTLTARSWAQEALLLHLAQRAGVVGLWETDGLETVASELRDRLRYSSLTDLQIELFGQEMQRLLKQLHDAGDP